MSNSIMDETRIISEYAGLFVHAHYSRDPYDGPDLLQYIVGDQRDGGVNIMPGATWFRTREDAMQAIDIYRVVDGDSQKFWHLMRAIHPQLTHEQAVEKYEAEKAEKRAEALPWAIGINGLTPLKRFATHDEAAEFIGGLEDAEDGRYYLDGPEGEA